MAARRPPPPTSSDTLKPVAAESVPEKKTPRQGQAGFEKSRLTFTRHRVVYALLRPLLGIFVFFTFNFRAQRYKNEDKQQPYFILSNHNGALDPFMLAQSFRQPIYFVASDHIFRLGFVSRVITWLVAPIPIVKSAIDIRAIRQILTIQKEGGTVCLFPSGNRSFTGPEMPIPAATGKLVKQLKVPVLLYRFEGGYLTSPRWARSHRKGEMTGRVVRELSPEEIATLSVDAINRILAEALDADPYLEPQNQRAFAGRHLAEYLERVLFVCPQCRGLNTLRSAGERLSCACGLTVRYRPDGSFAPVSAESNDILRNLPHVKSFDQFQKAYLKEQLCHPEFLQQHRTLPFFSDEAEHLTVLSRASHSLPVLEGRMMLFSDRLEFVTMDRTLAFPLASIGMMSVHGPQVLQFHDAGNDEVYEVRSKQPRSAYRYMVLFDLLRANRPASDT